MSILPNDNLLVIFQNLDIKSLQNISFVCKSWYDIWKTNSLMIIASLPDDIFKNISRIIKKYKHENPQEKILYFIRNLKYPLHQHQWKLLLILSIKLGYINLLKQCLTNINKVQFDDPHFVEEIIQLTIRRRDLALQIFNIIYNSIPENTTYCSLIGCHTTEEFANCLNKNETFLLEAIDRGQIEIVESILKNNKNNIGNSHSFGFSKACLQGNLNMVKLLHQYGADINYEDGWPLYMAQLSGSIKTVMYLIDNGASLISLSLKASTTTDNVKLVKLVFRLKPDIEEEDIQATFKDCLFSYHINTLKYLLTKIEPDITSHMISMLCLEEKLNSLNWLYKNHLLDGQPIFEVIQNNESIWKYKKSFKDLSYHFLN
jgi:hypothetical protein